MAANCYIYSLFTTLLFTNNLLLTRTEALLEQDVDDEFDFDGLPGAQHEFKVEVPSGKEECFYQHAKQGAKFHLSFEVLRGGDRKIDFYVRDPNHQLIASEIWKSDGALEKDIEIEGTYSFCLHNVHTNLASTLVFVYMYTYNVIDWEVFNKEIEHFESLFGNAGTSLGEVDKSISDMKSFQTYSRKNMIRDWYLIQGNRTYVSYYSVVQCLVIVASSCSQVYFLRRLFRTVSVTPTSKPRIYEVCLSNSKSQFTSKLIFLYMVVFKMSEWAQYAKELAEIHDIAANFSVKLTDVEMSVSEMFRFQTIIKMHDVKDWYTISSNNKYVGYWSLVQCIVIMMASALQVYFVRRLFQTVNIIPAMSQKA